MQRQFGLQAADALRGNAFGMQNLASVYQNLGTNDINNLMTAGNMVQDQEQLQRDLGYQEWLNAMNHPIDMLNLRSAAINNTPFQPGSSSTMPIYRNRTTGFLGGAASGAATGAAWGSQSTGPFAPYGALIGGLLGGLYGAYG